LSGADSSEIAMNKREKEEEKKKKKKKNTLK
jgi:hypothetical protein